MPYLLYDFIDERQQKRINIKIHLLSSLRSKSIKAKISSCGMKLLVECRLQSNFIDPQRHRESFRRPDGSFRFSVTDMRMVSFAHISSKLPRGADGLVWALMQVDLPFKVEADFYNEDVIPGYDLFICDQGLFLHLQLVGIDRAKAKEEKPLPGIRVVGARSQSLAAYNTPDGDHYTPPAPQGPQATRGNFFQGSSRHQAPQSRKKRKKETGRDENGTHPTHHFFATRMPRDHQGPSPAPNFGATFREDHSQAKKPQENSKPEAIPVGTTARGKVLFGPEPCNKIPNGNLMDFSPEKNPKNHQDEYEDDSDEISVESASFDHEGEADASSYQFESDCPQAANLMELKHLSDNSSRYLSDGRFSFAQGKKKNIHQDGHHLL